MAKTLTGVVVSDKADKTIVISVQTRKTHPIYKKQFTVSKRFIAHDENNEARTGDTVIISETRPISARKHFALSKITEKAAIREDQTVEAITKAEEPGAGERPKSKKKAEDDSLASEEKEEKK